MKKILYRASTLLLFVNLVLPIYANALEYQEDFSVTASKHFDIGLEEPNNPQKLNDSELNQPSENNLLMTELNEPNHVVVDAKSEYTVNEGTKIDEAFIKEKIIQQISVNDQVVAIDQVDVAISSQSFSTDNEQQITYSLSHASRSLLSENSDFFVQKDLRVTYAEAQLTAKPNAVTTVLGSKDTDFDLYTFVKDVKLGDIALTPDQYQVLLVDAVPSDTASQKKVTVRVILNADKSKMIEIEVPFNVQWGKSIAISGEWTGSETRRIVSTLTLHPDLSISMEPGQGASSLDYASLPTYNSLFFSTFSWYHADNLGILHLNTPDRQFSLKSKDTPKQIKEAWSNEIGGRLNVQAGDIVKVWHGRKTGEKYARPWLYSVNNEQFSDDTDGLNEVYYEVTQDGFSLIQLNRFSTNEVRVPIYSTKNYFDAHIDDFIDTKGLSNISKKFIIYPDTTSSGKKEATIQVEQTNLSGKKIQYDYPVSVIVEEGQLHLTVPQAMTFNNFKLQSEKQLIGIKNEGNNLLDLSITDSRGVGLQGNYELSLSMDDNSLLSQYVVYKESSDGEERFLNHSAIPIFHSVSEENPSAPSEKTPLSTWDSQRGLFLSIPANEPLKAQTYTGTLKWTLSSGP